MAAAGQRVQPVQRFASVTRLLPERRDEYIRLHADVWPDVRRIIRGHHVTNHSIFHLDGLLFRYYEYLGDDHGGDLRGMAEDPAMMNWAAVTDSCQESMFARSEERWAYAEEICHLD